MKTISHSDWKINYQNAKRYALTYISNSSVKDITITNNDLVHNAYLYWLENKNENLFTKPFSQIARIIKNVQANRYQKSIWQWKGQKAPRLFSTSLVTEERTQDDILHQWGFKFPEQEFESDDIITQMRARLRPIDNRILDYKVAGYKAKEIQKLEKTHNIKVTDSLKRIKKVMKETLLNPFNCSRVKVIKKISRKTYEANKDEYANYEFGEYAEHNEYYELLTDKNNPKEGILIKEQMRD